MFQEKIVEKIKTQILCSVIPPSPPENHAFYEITWNIAVGEHLVLQSIFFLSHFSNTNIYTFLALSRSCYIVRPSHTILFYCHKIWRRMHITKLLSLEFSLLFSYFFPV